VYRLDERAGEAEEECVLNVQAKKSVHTICVCSLVQPSREKVRVFMTDKRLDAWIPEELKLYLAERAERENRGMNLVLADLIREEQAREQGAIIEEQSLPIIRDIVRSELRVQLADLRRHLQDDMAYEVTTRLKEVLLKHTNRLAGLIMRPTRDSAVTRRMVFTVLAKAYGRDFAQGIFNDAREKVGQELAARPLRESAEDES
jgi:hypothetical protein